MSTNNGMKVTLWYKHLPQDVPRVLRNVTEVDYYHDKVLGKPFVAFESDIHSTGLNLCVDRDVLKFEVVPEDDIATSIDG